MKDHLLHKEFKLSKPLGGVRTIVLREIDGEDERDSARWLAAKGADDNNRNLSLMEEYVRISIVAVNGKHVEQPYAGMNRWSSKLRRYVYEAFNLLNGVEEDELAVFIGAATEWKTEQPDAAILNEDELARLKKKGSDAA